MAGDEAGPERVRVSFVRSGGFGGLRLATEIDTDALPAEEAAELRALVAACEAVPAGPPTAGGADRFRYDLTISGAGASRSLSVSDADLPPALRPLVERLEAHARTRR
jgi:hypothetical protein